MKLVKIKIVLFAVIVISGFFFSNCADQQQKTVARVGGRRITVKDFEAAFAAGKRTKEIQMATLEEKTKFLDQMINKRLKIINAYQLGLDKDKKNQNAINERVKGIMFRRLVDIKVVDKVLPESRVKEYYYKSKREINIRQIVLKFDKKTSKDKVLKKANKIINRLKNGENFAEIAKTESDDVKTAKDGGKKGYLKWGPRSSFDPIYKAAFSIKEGEISDPIEAADGYYIIKVINIKKYPAPPFEQQKERFKKSIFRVFSKEIEKAYYEYIEELSKKHKKEFNEDGLELFIERYNFVKEKETNSDDSTKILNKPSSPFDNFNESDKKQILVEFDFSDISINDFIEEIKKYPARRLPRMKGKEQLKSFLNQQMVPIALFEHEIDKMNIKNDDQVKKSIKTYLESLMEKNIYQIQVVDKVKISEDDIKKYFEDHREDYKHEPMKEVHEIYVKDLKRANKIVAEARRGAKFSSLFNSYNEKKILEKNKGKLGFITRGRAGIGKPAFKLKLGEVSEPIKIGNGYSIIKILSEKPETLKTFDESKKIASARLRKELLKKQEEEWYSKLRNKIDITIYEKNLERAGRKYVGWDKPAIN